MEGIVAEILVFAFVVAGLGGVVFLAILLMLWAARVGLSWLWDRTAQEQVHEGARLIPHVGDSSGSFRELIKMKPKDIRIA